MNKRRFVIMDNSEIKTFANIGVIACALILLYFLTNGENQAIPTPIIIVILTVIAIGVLLFINLYWFKEVGISSKILDKMTDKDYLKQIADDIHLIKIVVIAFAAVSILTTLFTLIYLANIFSHF